ncbi:MAG: DNA repair helicase XPB [Clostridia bacterium]
MTYQPDNPMIIQSDRTILLEVNNKKFEGARDFLATFAQLVKSPEHVYTYRLSDISLYNAIAKGIKKEDIRVGLEKYTKFDIPHIIMEEIDQAYYRYGQITLLKYQNDYILKFSAKDSFIEVSKYKPFQEHIKEFKRNEIIIKSNSRGRVKQLLLKLGYPVEDLAGYVEGEEFSISFRDKTLEGEEFSLRKYQKEAIDAFYRKGDIRGGNGVIVLPCGAGKTVVAMGIMSNINEKTIILTTSTVAVKQWKRELIDKMDINEEDIGEYISASKEIKPITITTYQMLTYRKEKSADFLHLDLFNSYNWGLIIYDEVHLLPAPVFRATVEVQSTRRLGLTATLVREDGLETDVFSLIGPKRFDMPWQTLEEQGHIAPVKCYEVRIAMPEKLRLEYVSTRKRKKFRLASENVKKNEIVEKLLQKHKNDQVLIVGHYLNQLKKISKDFDLPIITGETNINDRERLFCDFREGKIQALVVSKVANFAIDLPEASVAIQISGTFGSRQEEAQRLGRILRPFGDEKQAHFYTLVSRDSVEQEYALNRQLFLTEQGYKYGIYSPGSPVLFSKV